MLSTALKIAYDVGEKDKENSQKLDFYRCKIYENMAYIYSEQFFYQTAKSYMTRSQEIHDQNKEIFDSDQKIKFALKKANFMKKSGFYL